MATYLCPLGHVVLFDDDVVLPGKLSIGSHGYAQCFVNGKVTLLHRWLLGLDGGGFSRITDHINRNRLDNRSENLRVVTPSESNMNRTLKQRDLPVGVYLIKGRYRAQIKRNGVLTYLGRFDTPEEAAAVRSAAE